MGEEAKVYEEEIEESVCEFCLNTYKVETYWINPDSHLPEPDGERSCVCQISNFEEELQKEE